MREFMPCRDCLTVRMKASKIVEYGHTLQMVCPRCGRLDYVPVWGNKLLRSVGCMDRTDDAILRRRELRGMLKSIPAKHRRSK
jgi:hypothetical protein